jgi:hypothetical protein
MSPPFVEYVRAVLGKVLHKFTTDAVLQLDGGGRVKVQETSVLSKRF